MKDTDKDQYLSERTFKGGRFGVYERMLNSPADERKAFAWLVNHLHRKGILTVDEFDTMLFAVRLRDA